MKVILKERLEFGDPAILDASVQFRSSPVSAERFAAASTIR